MTSAVSKKQEKAIDASTFFNIFNGLEEFEQAAIALIPELEDEQIVEGIARAQALGETAWRIRAAFAAEAARRAQRLPGGRGQKDANGQGVTRALVDVANRSGVELRTIQEDRRILSTFKDTGALKCTRLDRQYFRIALQAPDPVAAIAVAEEKIEDPGYNTRQFKSYVDALKDEPDESKREKLEDVYWLNVPISQEARRAMVELCKRRNMQPGEVVSQALIEAEEWGRK